MNTHRARARLSQTAADTSHQKTVRRLSHRGVCVAGLYYNSVELMSLRAREDEKRLQVMWNPMNLGSVHILDEDTNEYLLVPCTDLAYANGLCYAKHKANMATFRSRWSKPC